MTAGLSLPNRLASYSRRVEAAAPPQGRFLPTPQGRLHVLERGDPSGPPLVLLHGASGNMLDFQSSVLDALASRWRVVAVDRPGHGYSEARGAQPWGVREQIDAIDAALEQLGLRRYALFGHSYGVALSIAWCAYLGEKVQGVLALSGGMYDWPGARAWRYQIGRRPLLGAAMGRLAPLAASPALLKRELAEVFAPQPVPDEYADRAGVWLALRPRTFALNLKSMAEMLEQLAPVRPMLPRLPMVVEAVNGDADEICVPTEAGPYAAKLPNSRLTWLQGVGHMPHHVAPEAVLDAAERLRARLPD